MLAMAGKREALAVDVVELSIEGAEPNAGGLKDSRNGYLVNREGEDVGIYVRRTLPDTGARFAGEGAAAYIAAVAKGPRGSLTEGHIRLSGFGQWNTEHGACWIPTRWVLLWIRKQIASLAIQLLGSGKITS